MCPEDFLFFDVFSCTILDTHVFFFDFSACVLADTISECRLSVFPICFGNPRHMDGVSNGEISLLGLSYRPRMYTSPVDEGLSSLSQEVGLSW